MEHRKKIHAKEIPCSFLPDQSVKFPVSAFVFLSRRIRIAQYSPTGTQISMLPKSIQVKQCLVAFLSVIFISGPAVCIIKLIITQTMAVAGIYWVAHFCGVPSISYGRVRRQTRRKKPDWPTSYMHLTEGNQLICNKRKTSCTGENLVLEIYNHSNKGVFSYHRFATRLLFYPFILPFTISFMWRKLNLKLNSIAFLLPLSLLWAAGKIFFFSFHFEHS